MQKLICNLLALRFWVYLLSDIFPSGIKERYVFTGHVYFDFIYVAWSIPPFSLWMIYLNAATICYRITMQCKVRACRVGEWFPCLSLIFWSSILRVSLKGVSHFLASQLIMHLLIWLLMNGPPLVYLHLLSMYICIIIDHPLFALHPLISFSSLVNSLASFRPKVPPRGSQCCWGKVMSWHHRPC